MTTTTSTPPVTVVSSGTSFITMFVTFAPTSVCKITLGQQYVLLLLQLIARFMLGTPVGLTHAIATPFVPDAFSVICQLCHGSSKDKFLFQSWASHQLLCHVFGVCTLLSNPLVATLSPVGAQPLEFVILQPYETYPWQAYVPPGYGLWPMPGVHWVAAHLTASSQGDPSATNPTAASHSSNIFGIQL